MFEESAPFLVGRRTIQAPRTGHARSPSRGGGANAAAEFLFQTVVGRRDSAESFSGKGNDHLRLTVYKFSASFNRALLFFYPQNFQNSSVNNYRTGTMLHEQQHPPNDIQKRDADKRFCRKAQNYAQTITLSTSKYPFPISAAGSNG